jgi:hypothetical protein
MNNADEDVEKMRQEYDFTNAVRTHRYADLYAQGTNVVLLEPDLAEAFPDSQSVNEALRSILKTSKKIHREGS